MCGTCLKSTSFDYCKKCMWQMEGTVYSTTFFMPTFDFDEELVCIDYKEDDPYNEEDFI